MIDCPYCGYQNSKVIDSRGIDRGVRRRRQCLHCGSRFTSYERVHTESFLVIKKDGRREEFDRDKLTAGIRKACAKRPIANETLEHLVDGIEEDLHHLGKVEVPSRIIGELVINRLRGLDRIAYIRFASVYHEFADIEALKEEVDALVQGEEMRPPSAQLPLLSGEEIQTMSRGKGKRSKAGKR